MLLFSTANICLPSDQDSLLPTKMLMWGSLDAAILLVMVIVVMVVMVMMVMVMVARLIYHNTTPTINIYPTPVITMTICGATVTMLTITSSDTTTNNNINDKNNNNYPG